MSNRYIANILFLCLFVGTAVAQGVDGKKFSILSRNANGAPSLIQPMVHTSTPPIHPSDSVSIVQFALREVANIATKLLALPPNATLTLLGNFLNGNHWITTFELRYQGIPIRERFLRMDIGAQNGEILAIRNFLPTLQPNANTASLTAEQAVQRIHVTRLSERQRFTTPALVFIEEKGKSFLRLCYEVIAIDNLFLSTRYTLDALSGEIIEEKPLQLQGCHEASTSTESQTQLESLEKKSSASTNGVLSGASGRVLASVHISSPYDTLTMVGLPYVRITANGVSTYTDSDGVWTLPNLNYPLNIETAFDGKFFTVARQDGSANSTLKTILQQGQSEVLWDRTNSDDAERDGFYAVSFARLSDKRIDEDLLGLDQKMKVRVNLAASCDAFYSDADTSLNFFGSGATCSNTAEVADVVFHEYGHRVIQARYQKASGKNINLADASLAEAFADLNSAFIRNDPRIGVGLYGDPKTTTKILRTCDNQKRWPTDISPDIHISSQILSGAFWDLGKRIGVKEAEHLFHFMQYEMPDGPGLIPPDSASLEDGFTSTLVATILADDDDNNLQNGTPHLKDILASFKLHNIGLENKIILRVQHINDFDTLNNFYPAFVNVAYTGIVGELDTSSLRLFYATQDENIFHPVYFSHYGGSLFKGVIPKVKPGSVVRYYAQVATRYGDTAYSALQSELPTFLVGYERKIFDDAENETGWSLSRSNYEATSGRWVRAKPNGTLMDSSLPLRFIQQDSDHTPNGSICYVTGNQTSLANDVGFDDVDSGTTTLTTPSFDLHTFHSPVIRYWYYYNNDHGQNPGIPIWKVEASNDNGANWKPVQLTHKSSNDSSGFPQWKEYTFLLQNYFLPTAATMFRFVASDYAGALVEAGVDDFEILDAVFGKEKVETGAEITILSAYPNPVRSGELFHLRSSGDARWKDLLGRTMWIQKSPDALIPSSIGSGVYFIESAGERLQVVVY
ncbi:MAG: hypothetical protein WCH46_10635 [bacterium]